LAVWADMAGGTSNRTDKAIFSMFSDVIIGKI